MSTSTRIWCESVGWVTENSGRISLAQTSPLDAITLMILILTGSAITARQFDNLSASYPRVILLYLRL